MRGKGKEQIGIDKHRKAKEQQRAGMISDGKEKR